MRVVLEHDAEKDPAHNESLETFYSQTSKPNADKPFYDHVIGSQEGECESVEVPNGEHIDAVIVYHYGGAIRNLQFKLSDNSYIMIGTNYLENYEEVMQEIVNLSHGEEILGVFGKLATRGQD